jgi:transcriptional regulator with XRE-family HTH domain
MLAAGERTTADIARELGVTPNLLNQWRKKAREAIWPGAEDKALAREVATLREMNALLREFAAAHPGGVGHDAVYRFMQTKEASCGVTLLAEAFGVSRQGYYLWKGKNNR